ncbi:MAG: hypothetical protein V4792_14440 [Pseudomonadota bacterium]
MTPWLLALAAALPCAAAVAAQSGDPLESADCQHAMASLQAQEDALARARRAGLPSAASAPDAELRRLRRSAAGICLGSRGDALTAPAGTVRQPIVVPPVAAVRPALAPRAPAPGAQTLKLVEPNLVVTACDAVGCWASDGSRLQRVGPGLVGPRGLCSVHGSLLQCP